MSHEVKKYFEMTTQEFDSLYEEDKPVKYFLNGFLRKGLYERVFLTIKEMDNSKGFSVFDIGCGSGRNSVLFAKTGASKVLGIDFSENMLDLAREYSERRNMAWICEFVNGDFMEYRSEEMFDYCIALGVFDYLGEPLPFLKKMRGMCRRKVIVSFPGKSLVRAPLRKIRYSLRGCPLFFYSKEEVEKLFRDAGFGEYSVVPYASSGYLGIGW